MCIYISVYTIALLTLGEIDQLKKYIFKFPELQSLLIPLFVLLFLLCSFTSKLSLRNFVFIIFVFLLLWQLPSRCVSLLLSSDKLNWASAKESLEVNILLHRRTVDFVSTVRRVFNCPLSRKNDHSTVLQSTYEHVDIIFKADLSFKLSVHVFMRWTSFWNVLHLLILDMCGLFSN